MKQITSTPILAAALIGFMAIAQASAVTISSQVGSTLAAAAPYYGQGVTTPVGGPWNSVSFSFDSQSGAGTTPYAAGDLFVLTLPYAGTPAGLSGSTPGFVGQSTGISGDFWNFPSGMTLNGGTTYYFYMGDRVGAVTTTIFGALNGDSPGLFGALSETSNYSGNLNDFDYQLLGTLGSASVPDNGSTMVLLGCGSMVLAQMRRKLFNS